MKKYTATLKLVFEAETEAEAQEIAGEAGESFNSWNAVNNCYVESVEESED